MKKIILSIIALLSTVFSNAEGIKIAEWNFDGGYAIDGKTLTPNGGAWAAITKQWFSDGQPTIYPDYCFSSLSSYKATGLITNSVGALNNNRAWAIIKPESGDDKPKTFRLDINRDENASGMTDADYTNPEKHYIFFEFSFPTTGFDNVQITYNLAFGGGKEKNFTTVVSYDNGTTWTILGTITTLSNWRNYKQQSYDLTDAANKDKVIIRMFPDGTAGSNWNMDYFTVTGNRTLTVTDAGYATWFHDSPVNIPENVTAYWGKLSSDKSKLEMTPIEDGIIPANTAVVLKAAQGSYSLTAATEAGSTYNDNVLRGVKIPTTVSSLSLGTGTLYVLGLAQSTGKAAFCKFTGTTLGDHRAYLFLGESSAKELKISFNDDEATDIIEIENTHNNCYHPTKYYNLSGQQVERPNRGLYICNGKKVIVK